MTRNALARQLVAALARPARPSSDFDLNRDLAPPVPAGALRAAGVLIPIVAAKDGARVILTKRASGLKHHPGQIAFPGGKVDPGDGTAIRAALREAQEEIGLDPGRIEVIGEMPRHTTVTGFAITPVIGLIEPGFVPVPEAGEVEEVFDVPLAHLTLRDNYAIEGRIWHGVHRRYYTVPWGPYYIWGATARMLLALADRFTA